MKIVQEGIIKYDRSNFSQTPPLARNEYLFVEKWRKILNQLNLIGCYSDGLGYGNISQKRDYTDYLKTNKPQFIISGTQTGKLNNLTGAHYTRVIDFDIEHFSVTTAGPIESSSETVTHASIYEQNSQISGVIHIHNKQIWQGMIDSDYQSTSKWIEYGTLEMALAVKECVGNGTQGNIVMKGHYEGVIAYGPNLVTAGNIIIKLYQKFVDEKFSL